MAIERSERMESSKEKLTGPEASQKTPEGSELPRVMMCCGKESHRGRWEMGLWKLPSGNISWEPGRDVERGYQACPFLLISSSWLWLRVPAAKATVSCHEPATWPPASWSGILLLTGLMGPKATIY